MLGVLGCCPAPLAARLAQGGAVLARMAAGVWRDGFIHAGNLAYMTLLAIFPFFIVMGGLFSLLGQGEEQAASIHAVVAAMPPVVAQVLEPVGRDVLAMRHGWLVWAGTAVGLWTVSSLIETIRDILRRAYGAERRGRAVWRHRLVATGLVMGAVVLLLAGLYVQVALATFSALVRLPVGAEAWAGRLMVGQFVPLAALFVALYGLFYALTPRHYRRAPCPKWPGALLVTLWWGAVSLALPVLLRTLFQYDMIYGSLAGVAITLFFFWLVGLGMVTGAELNAALAAMPEPQDWLGQADDRAREAAASIGRAKAAQMRDDR